MLPEKCPLSKTLVTKARRSLNGLGASAKVIGTELQMSKSRKGLVLMRPTGNESSSKRGFLKHCEWNIG